MNRYAYVTLLSSDNYLPGVLGLFNSLRATKTLYPFVVVATRVSEETIDILSKFDLTIVNAYPINPPENVAKYNKEIGLGIWNNCFDKFHIFNLDVFDKIIYLDADMEVLENVDELFRVKTPGFVKDPAKHFQITDFKDYTTNNAGMMVIEPSVEVFKTLIEILENWGKVDVREKQIIVSDQYIFDSYYKDWFSENGFLDFSYNAFFPYLEFYSEENKVFSPKIIHYAGMDKPWKEPFNELLSYNSPIAFMYKAKLLALLKEKNLPLQNVSHR